LICESLSIRPFTPGEWLSCFEDPLRDEANHAFPQSVVSGLFSIYFLPAAPEDGDLSAAYAAPDAVTHSCFNLIYVISILYVNLSSRYGSCKAGQGQFQQGPWMSTLSLCGSFM